MAKIGYVRCSTADQNPASQIEEMKKAGVELYEVEHMSGTKRDRPVLNLLMDSLRRFGCLQARPPVSESSRIVRDQR